MSGKKEAAAAAAAEEEEEAEDREDRRKQGLGGRERGGGGRREERGGWGTQWVSRTEGKGLNRMGVSKWGAGRSREERGNRRGGRGAMGGGGWHRCFEVGGPRDQDGRVGRGPDVSTQLIRAAELGVQVEAAVSLAEGEEVHVIRVGCSAGGLVPHAARRVRSCSQQSVSA
eukprot:3452990-Rhodomonas_salina.1